MPAPRSAARDRQIQPTDHRLHKRQFEGLDRGGLTPSGHRHQQQQGIRRSREMRQILR